MALSITHGATDGADCKQYNKQKGTQMRTVHIDQDTHELISREKRQSGKPLYRIIQEAVKFAYSAENADAQTEKKEVKDVFRATSI